VSEALGEGEHSRTLEFYGQFGFGEEVVQRGIVSKAVHLREAGTGGRH
jgi:hypothetical protein